MVARHEAGAGCGPAGTGAGFRRPSAGQSRPGRRARDHGGGPVLRPPGAAGGLPPRTVTRTAGLPARTGFVPAAMRGSAMTMSTQVLKYRDTPGDVGDGGLFRQRLPGGLAVTVQPVTIQDRLGSCRKGGPALACAAAAVARACGWSRSAENAGTRTACPATLLFDSLDRVKCLPPVRALVIAVLDDQVAGGRLRAGPAGWAGCIRRSY